MRNGVALALLLKLVALFVLFFLFFAPSGTRGAYDAFFQPVVPPILATERSSFDPRHRRRYAIAPAVRHDGDVSLSFVPLTLGLSVLLAVMESVYVMTGRVIWRDMTKFWGVLFGINFAMGVATGITMEFQFGTNWAYYSQYVGDIFGAPLAIEGLMAFFLEATFVGLFFSAGKAVEGRSISA